MLNVLLIGILIGVAIGIVTVQWLGSTTPKKQHSQHSANLRVLLGKSRFQALRDRPPASPELQQKLIDLFQGDREAAEQWVAKARFGRPGKSEAYYWFRAIQLLEQHSFEQHSFEQHSFEQHSPRIEPPLRHPIEQSGHDSP
ncbi:hypothetical protein [Alkalinema sp. FACHB-956]|uniref:hypothetical protein n=1 Tax=Alkalinema sp. FACHB-956 TaxID=2692768 RepID=UPI00168331A1|nr:hypothetical protein [Alkalinema sp. FACHB-956]MBD2329857.1 hypothetical protein [Alkalinema sp. FACHB-956]